MLVKSKNLINIPFFFKTDVKVKRNIEDEDEEEKKSENEPPIKKIKVEYSCDKCEASFTTDTELREHCQSEHKDDTNKTSILESVLSEGKRVKSEDEEITENRKENGVSSSNIKTESDRNFMHQLGLMPDTTDKSSLTPSSISKLKIVRKVYINDDTPSKCEMCGKEWPAKRHLWQHLIR